MSFFFFREQLFKKKKWSVWSLGKIVFLILFSKFRKNLYFYFFGFSIRGTNIMQKIFFKENFIFLENNFHDFFMPLVFRKSVKSYFWDFFFFINNHSFFYTFSCLVLKKKTSFSKKNLDFNKRIIANMHFKTLKIKIFYLSLEDQNILVNLKKILQIPPFSHRIC